MYLTGVPLFLFFFLGQDVDGHTPIHVAITNRHDGLVSLLLSHPKLDLALQDKLGRTPLHSAMVTRNNKAATGIVERNPAAVNLVSFFFREHQNFAACESLSLRIRTRIHLPCLPISYSCESRFSIQQ